MCDMMNTETLEEKIVAAVELKNRTLEAFRQPALSAADIREFCKTYRAYAERIAPFVVDSAAFLNQCIRDGKSLLLEGAQATLLDVDHGTYPFVTSSNASAGGIASGLGIAPRHVHGVVGITKAYTTRVGTGPFPTEAAREHDELLRSRGVEYGATTGRPRRCGWFDGPGGRYAAMLNGLESLVVTKVDVLDAFAEIPVCVEYKYKGSVLKEFPAEAAVLAHVKPVYKTLRGWQTSTLGIQEWSQMPQAAQDYLKFLSDYLGAPLRMISTGPTRDQTIVL
jgi:adenylosuccinate synthase